MVNEEKVRIMTQIALDETKNLKKEVDECGYYKSDYVRSHVFSSIWNVTVCYLSILVLIALYHINYIFINIVQIDYKKIGLAVLGIYCIILIICIFFSYYHYMDLYIENKKKLRGYFKKLKELDEYYMENKEEIGDDTATRA